MQLFFGIDEQFLHFSGIAGNRMDRMKTSSIYTQNEEYRKLFGRKAYKVSLSANCTCPNRDGMLGAGGCAFCTGSGEFSESVGSVSQRIEAAALRVRSKLPAGQQGNGNLPSLIAYFQDHTNTYAPSGCLKTVFDEAITHPLVCGMSVGTRPDCLPDDIVEMLSEYARVKPVWVELGLQTANDVIASSFGRGYPSSVYAEAAEKLRDHGIRVTTHLIIGLPGETPEQIFESVRFVNGKTDCVKFHMLHILKGTRYAEEYGKGLIATFSLPEYMRILTECIRWLDPGISVGRMTGDGYKRTLIAPKWSGDKKHVLNSLRNHFDKVGLRQGEYLTFHQR